MIETNLRELISSVGNFTLSYFDVNSLFPYVMSKYELPTGKLVHFEGNILNPDLVSDGIIKEGLLGFYYCIVKAPIDLKHPIIQIRHKGRTIAPVGEFKAMLY